MDGSIIIDLPDLLVRVGHHRDGRPFVESCSSITQDGRDSVQRSSSQDEHWKDEVIKLIFLVLYSMPIRCVSSHLGRLVWTTCRTGFSLHYQNKHSNNLFNNGTCKNILRAPQKKKRPKYSISLIYKLNIAIYYNNSNLYYRVSICSNQAPMRYYYFLLISQ